MTTNQTVTTTISAVIALAAIVALVNGLRAPRLPVDTAPFNALGEAAAETAAKLVDGQGQILVVTTDPATSQIARDILGSFTAAVKRQGRLQIAAIQTLPINEILPAIPAEVFLGMLARHPNASAMVSFCGAPDLSDEQIRQLGSKKPKVIALTGLNGLKRSLQSGLVDVAIIPRFEPLATDPRPATSREKFNEMYQLVTADDANTLPKGLIPEEP